MSLWERIKYYYAQFWDNPFTMFAAKPGEPDPDHNSVTGRGGSDDPQRDERP